MDKILRLASQSVVVIFSKSTCCMSYTIKILFQGIGVEPMVYEIDQDPDGREMEKALKISGSNAPPVPTVYVGGQLVGSAENVMSLHLSGRLIQMLQNYQQLS